MSQILAAEQKAWALVLGTVFFAVISYWLVALSVPPDFVKASEVGVIMRSILGADAAWFFLLGWVLTSSVYLGFSRWPKFFKLRLKWTKAERTLAWKKFRFSLWISVSLSLLWVGFARQLGLLQIQSLNFDVSFLLSELHLLTDPFASFVLLFVLLDLIRGDLFSHAIRSQYASVVALLVTVAVEVWIWSEYLGLSFASPLVFPLVLVVLWCGLVSYESLLQNRSGAFWSRLGFAIGGFLIFDLGLSLVNSPWSSGWSFFVTQIESTSLLVALGSVALAALNVAVLHRFSRSLTQIA
jgi:hypothetical protein